MKKYKDSGGVTYLVCGCRKAYNIRQSVGLASGILSLEACRIATLSFLQSKNLWGCNVRYAISLRIVGFVVFILNYGNNKIATQGFFNTMLRVLTSTFGYHLLKRGRWLCTLPSFRFLGFNTELQRTQRTINNE